jgi:hypothetical protein
MYICIYIYINPLLFEKKSTIFHAHFVFSVFTPFYTRLLRPGSFGPTVTELTFVRALYFTIVL